VSRRSPFTLFRERFGKDQDSTGEVVDAAYSRLVPRFLDRGGGYGVTNLGLCPVSLAGHYFGHLGQGDDPSDHARESDATKFPGEKSA
jgi:hypothetical protein